MSADAEKDDGGYAFPLAGDVRNYFERADGMALRDWFAGQALVGLHAGTSGDFSGRLMAIMAYKQADLMIEERNRK